MSINVNYALRESPQATIDDMQRIVDGVASELEVIAFAEKINAMHQHIEKLENKNDVDEQMAGEILRQVLRYGMTLFVQTLIEAHPKRKTFQLAELMNCVRIAAEAVIHDPLNN